MGKSSGAKNVNTELQSQYDNYNGGNSPFKKLGGQLQDSLNQNNDYINNQLPGLSNTFGSFARGGGLNPEYASGVKNSLGGFQDFANNGGFNDKEQADFRARAGSSIPSYYANLKNDFQNQNRVNNGLNPGYTSQMSKMARDEFQGAQDANLNTETALHGAMNDNKKFGLQGVLSGNENLLDASQRGQMAGLSGLSGLFNTMSSRGMGLSSQMLQSLGMNADQINAIMGTQSGRNTNQSAFQQYFNPIVGAGTTLASSMLAPGVKH